MNNVKDVIVINDDLNKLKENLEKIKKGVNIIYSNSIIDLHIGQESIKNRYKLALYNEDSRIIMILTNDSIFNKDDIIKYLEQNNVLYSEITFKKYKTKQKKESENITFVNDRTRLEKELQESLKNGNNEAIYYPFVSSTLFFNYNCDYKINYTYHTEKYRGVIKLKDKIILIYDYDSNNETLSRIILNILKEMKFKTQLIFDEKPNIVKENNKQLTKTL